MDRRFRSAVVVLALLASAAPAFGHHSFTAEFDPSTNVTLQGTITKLDWINPHVYIYIDVKDDSGKVVNWQIESWPTGLLHKAGLTRDRLSPNQQVTVTSCRAKDGTKNLVWLETIAFSDGTHIEVANGNSSPTAGGDSK